MANKQPKPTKHADTSDSENNTDATQAGTEAGGEQDTPITSIEDLDPSIQEAINRRIAAARREGEEKGKNKVTSELEKQTEAERQRRLEEEQEFKPLYESEKAKRIDAENKATAAEKSLLALEVALEAKLPNPHLAAKRLIGDTREELMTDAKSLLKVLKSDESEGNDKSDKKGKKGTNDEPPATSEGGDADLGDDIDEGLEDTKVYAQKATDTYNW